MSSVYQQRREMVEKDYESTILAPNHPLEKIPNGIYERFQNPVITRNHVPPFWRYDYNPETNPYFMERLGVNATLNPGAILLNGKHVLVIRTEGNDRKSIFAIAESDNGIDNFRFWDEPLVLPENDTQVTNIYDMRLTSHQDGWIYGVFCVESKDPKAAVGDDSSAVAQCGIARTKDLKTWERLSDIKTPSAQQRNVVLHSEFVDGKYAFYTRPQSEFISGSQGGIGFGLSKSIEHAVIENEVIMDRKYYHGIHEVKNGPGAPPIKTDKGWLHIAHGVRNCAAGLRYVLYAFLCDLKDPSRVIARPGGHFMAPLGDERVGDVSNVLFLNGLIAKDNGEVYIYYASSDTRVHVAKSNVDLLLDYVLNTPQDARRSYECTQQRLSLIQANRKFM